MRKGESPDIIAIDLLDPEDPFEIDDQNAHLFKHLLPAGLDDNGSVALSNHSSAYLIGDAQSAGPGRTREPALQV